MSLTQAFEQYAQAAIGRVLQQWVMGCQNDSPAKRHEHNKQAFDALMKVYAEVGREFKAITPRLSLTDRHTLATACRHAPRTYRAGTTTCRLSMTTPCRMPGGLSG